MIKRFICKIFGWTFISQDTIDRYDICGTVSEYIEINV